MTMNFNGHNLWIIPVIVIVIALGVILSAGGGMTGLRRWAAEQNFTLLTVEHRWLRQGPFFFRAGKGDKVYYFTAANSSGQKRSGYARVRPPLAAVISFSEPVKIAWEDSQWR
jgi:hypothetical protein